LLVLVSTPSIVRAVSEHAKHPTSTALHLMQLLWLAIYDSRHTIRQANQPSRCERVSYELIHECRPLKALVD
jgi:hypothetical protein